MTLKDLRIPRLVLNRNHAETIRLIVFCDASEKAFGTGAYLWSGSLRAALITSRGRPAPIKRLTLARLELLALNYVRRPMTKGAVPITIFSDSQLAICWTKNSPYRFKNWVCWVYELQELVS